MCGCKRSWPGRGRPMPPSARERQRGRSVAGPGGPGPGFGGRRRDRLAAPGPWPGARPPAGIHRTIAQLYGVGLILAAVFTAAHWYWVVLILVVMTGVATHAAVSRLARPIPGGYGIAATALTVSTAATLAYVIGVVVQVRPWYEPQYIIPHRRNDPRQLDDQCGPGRRAPAGRAEDPHGRGGDGWRLASPDTKPCSHWCARRCAPP